MKLNELRPSYRSKFKCKRVGRGIGSGLGKTCGRGHKGQKARAGGYHKVGFEGGQMPLQRRLPKFGFRSLKSLYHQELSLIRLAKLQEEIVDIKLLKEKGYIKKSTKTVKIYGADSCVKNLTLKGIKTTKSAKMRIEEAGGKVID